MADLPTPKQPYGDTDNARPTIPTISQECKDLIGKVVRTYEVRNKDERLIRPSITGRVVAADPRPMHNGIPHSLPDGDWLKLSINEHQYASNPERIVNVKLEDVAEVLD
jgi:hypothetical protein